MSLGKIIQECINDELKETVGKFESKIVSTEEEIIRLSDLGYDPQPIGANKWPMGRANILTYYE